MAEKLAILGGGNIGGAIARGLVACGTRRPADILVTRRHSVGLAALEAEGFGIDTDNCRVVAQSRFVFLCVQPAQVMGLVDEIRDALDATHHRMVSVATGVTAASLVDATGGVPVIRAMPNTAIVLGESMTCLSGQGVSDEDLAEVKTLFDALGSTAVIDEDQMNPATALCACGVAFFLRAIRAASQGGIEIGFHAEEALAMAAQTARGAASLLLQSARHPESEIDRVTTPMGCTIAGLNRMEHEGFSSAMIRGIVTSSDKAATLGDKES